MGRGGQSYLSYTALVLLSRVYVASADSWGLDIDQGPAPSPQDGPPFSANALRDPAWLPYQIVGIVGSYVITILIIGTLILLVGQPARRRAQYMATCEKSKELKPRLRTDLVMASPLTSADQSSWYSPRRLGKKKNSTVSIVSVGSATLSPTSASVASFDTSVIEADKVRRAAEMEKLFAAVMADDDRVSQGRRTRANSQVESGETFRKAPPRLITDAPSLRHLRQDGPTSPRTPVRAIYPPEKPYPALPYGPSSPIKHEYSAAPLSPTYSSATLANSRTPSLKSPVGSTFSPSVPTTPSRTRRKSMKHLKISSPIMRSRDDDNDDGARTPLTPRYYPNPGIPPEPPTSRTTATIDDIEQPLGTGTGTIFSPSAYSFDHDRYDDGEEDEVMDQVRDLPFQNSQRNLAPGRLDTQQPIIRKPEPSSAASMNNPLPFRQYQNTHNEQQQNLQQDRMLHIPHNGPIKTTIVEARRDRLAAGTPRTGLVTPYSAYMPFTPLTPVTPHLSSRAERKQRRKEERTIQGAITEEDQVADDKELWDSGY